MGSSLACQTQFRVGRVNTESTKTQIYNCLPAVSLSILPFAFLGFQTNLKIQTAQPSNDAPYHQNISKQEVNSFGFYIKSDYKNLIRSQCYDYIGTDAKEKFVETIVLLYNEISKSLFKYSKANKTVKLTPTQ